MVITSVENNKIKELSKLKESKYRKKNNQFIVEGYHLVEEANKYLYASREPYVCFSVTGLADKLPKMTPCPYSAPV